MGGTLSRMGLINFQVFFNKMFKQNCCQKVLWLDDERFG